MSELKLPWVLGERIDDKWEASPSGGWQEIKTGEHSAAILVVVRMQDEESDLPSGIAALRVVLAAPDLLEALIAITDQLERIGDTRPHKDGRFIDDARAAIAKATGDAVNEVTTKESEYREALEQIANGATGFLDRDTDLANIAKRALGMEVY
jgi:hypothetical protein